MDFEIKKSETQGTAMFALRDFKLDEVVYKLPRGKIISREEYLKLSEYDRDHSEQVDQDRFELLAEPVKFVNHSCDPNVVEEVNETERVAKAIRQIKKGEEIALDYRIRSDEDWQFWCNCKSHNCMGKVKGSFFTLPPMLQKRYLQYAPAFIQEKYKKKLTG